MKEHKILWLLDQENEQLRDLSQDDPLVRSLLASLHHCHTEETAIRLLAQAIIHQSRMGAHWRKLATDVLALTAKPAIIEVPP